MNAAKETLEDDEDKQPIAFMNFDCDALIKDNSGVTQILHTGASTHMTPHRNLLADYKKFPKPRKVCVADKGTFEALGSSTLVIVRATLEHCGGYTVTQADRGENQSMNNQPKYNEGDLT